MLLNFFFMIVIYKIIILKSDRHSKEREKEIELLTKIHIV